MHFSVARNTPRSSTSHLRQVFDCPPSLGPTPPVIVSNITRLGNLLSVRRATVPAKKSRHSQMVVSTPSHRVLLSAFEYERVVKSVRSRR